MTKIAAFTSQAEESSPATGEPPVGFDPLSPAAPSAEMLVRSSAPSPTPLDLHNAAVRLAAIRAETARKTSPTAVLAECLRALEKAGVRLTPDNRGAIEVLVDLVRKSKVAATNRHGIRIEYGWSENAAIDALRSVLGYQAIINDSEQIFIDAVTEDELHGVLCDDCERTNIPYRIRLSRVRNVLL